ncbi:hypothetical protein F1D05_18540 [Kribbella qitaiheensis]|uniref:PknH-like extracellular domain-containing protein n=1 Tax=Kribbella qitaiheensis TaxID=1544730 RepID=A0A7G6WZY6_9ACTN|nr:hypothetical protein [Kribbella qitaiheensis]QNE19551.1 hypothetical protein F1D05_18540 [Kribbella qitaiheensis]
MGVRGSKRVAVVATAAAVGFLVVACGNDQKPTAGSGTPTGAPTSMPTETVGTPTVTPSRLPPKPGTATPGDGPSQTPGGPTPTSSPSAPVRVVASMLLTGVEVAKADPNRRWAETTGSASTPICGRASTRGDGVAGSLSRNYANGLDASGGQWLTRYKTPAAAKAAYESIVKTIKSCKAARPAPTHARKLTENRTLAAGDATSILRWYDYPLPSDPGSEDGGFPYAVTLKGSVVSVVAFREMGKGVKPANFEKFARLAAAHLP